MARVTEKQLALMDELRRGTLLYNSAISGDWTYMDPATFERFKRVNSRTAMSLVDRGIVVRKRADSWGYVYGLADGVPG